MNSNRQAVANLEFLKRVFSIPEHEKATLNQLEKKLSENLNDFLNQNIVVGEISLTRLAENFSDSTIPVEPEFVTDHVKYLLNQVIPYCVNTSSPKFIGHMTSALPYFLQSLSKCMVALHQNVVKIETSRSFTLLEKQTLGMLHRLVYNQPDKFYEKHLHSRSSTLGLQTSGGTTANISALWIARNLFIQKVMGKEEGQSAGLIDALDASGYKNACIFVSSRGHYSLKKSADILGIGKKNLIRIAVDKNHKIDLIDLENKILEAEKNKLYPMAIIGVAGTTETGHIDDLQGLAQIARKHDIFYHIDAAWGGPVLFSKTNKTLLKGIEEADSVSIDGHKQLYLPMGIGYLLFRNPDHAMCIEEQANYIIRDNSFDLGRRSLEGSRPGKALLAFSALRIFGQRGYELILDRNIQLAKEFAQLIQDHPHFEIITSPELNLLTYRFNPQKTSSLEPVNTKNLNAININLQKMQRDRGKSFVSRTMFRHPEPNGESIVVLRAVLANPHTELNDLEDVLREQSEIGQELLKDI